MFLNALHALASCRCGAAPGEGGPAHVELGLISEGTNTWPLYAAQSLGLFVRAGLHVEVSVVGSFVSEDCYG